jgi:hypothetical protein
LKLLRILLSNHKTELFISLGVILLAVLIVNYTDMSSGFYHNYTSFSGRSSFNLATLILVVIVLIAITYLGIVRKGISKKDKE